MVVKFKGNLGFIKPHFSRMDGYTKSQHFLLPSNHRGIEQLLSLDPYSIKRSKLIYSQYIDDQVKTEALNAQQVFNGDIEIPLYDYGDLCSILKISLLKDVEIFFEIDNENVNKCINKTIYVARNEFPCFYHSTVETDFDEIKGFEFIETGKNEDTLFGYNYYTNYTEIRGYISKTS